MELTPDHPWQVTDVTLDMDKLQVDITVDHAGSGCCCPGCGEVCAGAGGIPTPCSSPPCCTAGHPA